MTLLLMILSAAGRLVADERLQTASPSPIVKSSQSAAPLIGGFRIDLSGLSKSVIESRTEVPPQPQMSRSRGPLRRVTLVGGDRFDAEFLSGTADSTTFRLLTGQVIRVPATALAAMSNPPGEVDVLDESFEADSAIASDPLLGKLIDESQAVDGRRSIRFRSDSPEFRQALAQPLASARIEFWFRCAVNDSSSKCGEWQLEWSHGDDKRAPTILRIGSDQRIAVIGAPKAMNATTQSVRIDDGWHAFVALVTPEQTRLIVDEAILASFPTAGSSIAAVRFPARGVDSTNLLWIDAMQVRSLQPVDEEIRIRTQAVDDDSVVLAAGDELFGRLLNVTRAGVLIETFGQKQPLAWNQLSAIAFRQPSQAVRQTTNPNPGVVSVIELQTFVDRPEMPPARWTVTVLSSDSKCLIAQHPLVGELTIPWSVVRRVDSMFFGQSLLLDARTFHLGNSIRPDFRRHLPDGTELEVSFRLNEIPRGRPYLSLEVSELEAAGPTAPPGSPFLAELRSGRLITEGLVNDHRIGSVNSLIRFRSAAQNPERVRMPIPRGILNVGDNSFRLRQVPLKYPGQEFDDCGVSNLRLEFDQ